jgi:hypothetical protein
MVVAIDYCVAIIRYYKEEYGIKLHDKCKTTGKYSWTSTKMRE